MTKTISPTSSLAAAADLDVIKKVQQVVDSNPTLKTHHCGELEVAQPGRFISVEDTDLSAEIRQAISRRFPAGLFRHQGLGIQSILSGRHTVVSTSTSSGKSLVHLLPIMEKILQDPQATALLVYPQKALANDQLLKVEELVRSVPELEEEMRRNPYMVRRFDGATDSACRNDIKERARIILTNPEMLHLSVLQHHDPKWSRFLGNLSCVVIDECHEYRGIFGTNVSYIFRRLRQLCASYGADPIFVATSATVSDPAGHLQRLTGHEYHSIGPDEDGSIRGPKKLWILSGDDHVYDEARKLGMGLAKKGLSTLVFCQSRKGVENMLAVVRGSSGELPDYVQVYRAGLSAQQREEIELGLRSGEIRLVFSTSALELGIDIGALDAVICAGFPASQMSLMQRAGRVGRGGREGAFIMIPSPIPIDSYYAGNPGTLLDRDSEELSLQLDNNRVLCQHYACVVKEAGGAASRLDFEILGESMQGVHQDFESGALEDDIFYCSEPHMQVNVRGGGGQPYKIMLRGAQVGDIGEYHLLREAYRNAVYLHGGKRYRVKDVYPASRTVNLAPEFSGKKTTPIISTSIKQKRRGLVKKYPGLTLATVAINVTELLVNVVETERGNKTNEWKGSSGMPAHIIPTEGVWIELHPEIWGALCSQLGSKRAAAALGSCTRLLRSLFQVLAGLCDTQDYWVESEVNGDGSAGIYLYDQVYDGIGLTADRFDQMEELLKVCLEHLESCSCRGDEGCLSCIANPNDEEDCASKKATRKVLRRLLAEMAAGEPSVEGDPAALRGRVTPENVDCESCEALVPISSKFCPNCGTKMEEES